MLGVHRAVALRASHCFSASLSSALSCPSQLPEMGSDRKSKKHDKQDAQNGEAKKQKHAEGAEAEG